MRTVASAVLYYSFLGTIAFLATFIVHYYYPFRGTHTIQVKREVKVARKKTKKPNFIVFQPDDLHFLERWTPQPHNDEWPVIAIGPKLPHIERLRTQGVQMMEAYAASAMCGTSRFSTLTGRYPSRAAYSRDLNWWSPVANVRIPLTKLVDESDVPDGQDCSNNNLAALMKKNGYRTGMTGKWHLTDVEDEYTYSGLQDTIRDCGFDVAESIYAENQDHDWQDGSFSHNMEHMAEKGVEFIKADPSTPFFMYFNPTVPHSSGDVYEALTEYDCRDTPEGRLSKEPVVKGMTEGQGCEKYRESVLKRAHGKDGNNYLGSIWLDDAVGALLQALTDTDQLDNTFFLFQMDHGIEGKATIYESGARIAQFIHFPDYIPAMKLHGMVSTVDVAKTILDYAGIDEDSPGYYEMDGKSWRPAIESEIVASTWDEDRCIFIEMDYDRAVRCGCYKYMKVEENATTYFFGNEAYELDDKQELLFDLCDKDGVYEHIDNKEIQDIKRFEPDLREEMQYILECHLERVRPNQEQDYSPCGDIPAATTSEISDSW